MTELVLSATPYRLAPHAEDYRCTWFPAPDTPQAIKTFHPVAEKGAHHLALFWTPEPVQAERSCRSFGRSWVLRAGSGVGSGEAALPSGVALPLRRSGSYVLQVHMLNTGESPMTVSGAYRLDLTRPGEQFTRAGVFVMGNTHFTIPAHATGFEVEQTCAAKLPAGELVSLFPHMHGLGRRFIVERLGSVLYDERWAFDDQAVVPFAPAVPIAQGDSLRIRCIYDNATDEPVAFGDRTSDEMCFGIFYYQPATLDEIDCVN